MEKTCPYCGCVLERLFDNEWYCPGCGESFYTDSPKDKVNIEDDLNNYSDDEDDNG
ncbi:MAG: hypothetical protein K6G48_05790 [Acholeplasmatales bacterium]|nr:hypothetical protein [Acholeplasmatales bacterium]